MTTDPEAAEAALRALALDLVEELAAGRALEMSQSLSEGDIIELATFNVRPFQRVERTRSGRVITETVRGHTESREGPGHIPAEAWLRGQQEWAKKGEAIWAANRWKGLHPGSASAFAQHVQAAHEHLAPESGQPRLAKGYEHLHEAHRLATEQLLPRAETPEQRQSIREGIRHISDRMKEIDKAAGVKPTRTGRLTGAVPERAERAAEKIGEPSHPAVRPPVPALPPPPTGAQAVHPGLGGHMARLPGGSISQHEMRHVAQPLPQEAPSPEAQALEHANKRLEGYAKREEAQHAADLRDHLAELRAAEAQRQGIAPEGEYTPLTDEQFHSHVQQLESKIEEALRAGLATDQQFSLDGQGQVWSPERAMLHAQILHEYLDKQVDVPSQKHALFLGGLPGAGKSSLLRSHPEIDLRNYAVLNPDDFKEALAEKGAVPHVEGLSPMERAALIHEESAYLTDLAAAELERRGKNVAWDVTMKSHDITAARIKELKYGKGYQIHAVFVDVPVEKSADRVVSRYRRGLEQYRQGKDPMGGRYVPRYVILRGEDKPGISRARETFEKLKPEFASWELHDGREGKAQLVARGGQRQRGVPSVEELRRSQYTGATEAAARAAETGQGDVAGLL